MTNNKLCDILGGIGCGISAWCMGLMFFGLAPAIWGVIFGLLLCVLGLLNYE